MTTNLFEISRGECFLKFVFEEKLIFAIMEEYVGKLAVVTGASSGIGLEIAKELVKRGVNVVGLARNKKNLQVGFKLSAQKHIEHVAKFC